MADALDALRCGVILVDERAMILHANRAAERMLAEDELIQAQRGVLGARIASAQKQLRAAIAQAARRRPLWPARTSHVVDRTDEP